MIFWSGFKKQNTINHLDGKFYAADSEKSIYQLGQKEDMSINWPKIRKIGFGIFVSSYILKSVNAFCLACSLAYPSNFLFKPINLNLFKVWESKNKLFEIEKQYLASTTVDEHFEIDNMHRAYLEKKIEENPKNIQALIQLGVLCWEPFHEQNRALEYLEKAVEYDPQNVDALFWGAKCIYHDFCAYEGAKQLLRLALTIDPKRADCLDLLATIIEDFDRNDAEALEYVKKAVELAPDWPACRAFLVSLYVKLHDIPSAERELEKLEELCKLPLIKPKNGVEDYYENIVTGRGSKMMAERIAALKERIQKAKDLGKIIY